MLLINREVMEGIVGLILFYSDFLPALEGRGFPSKGFIVPTIGSGLHPSFGEQSSGSENHSHLKGGLSSKLRLVP